MAEQTKIEQLESKIKFLEDNIALMRIEIKEFQLKILKDQMDYNDKIKELVEIIKYMNT